MASRETLFDEDEGAIVRAGNLLVFVRTGTLTLRGLDRLESSARLVRSSSQAPVGVMAVVEESAPVSDGEMRSRQRELLDEMLAGDRTFLVLALGFTGVRSQLMRTVARTLYHTEHAHVARDLEEGASWLGPKIDMSPGEVLDVLAHTRALAARR